MLVYKVSFLNNEIISCTLVDPAKHKEIKGDLLVSQSNGLLIFALIKANSKLQALKKAAKLIDGVGQHDTKNESHTNGEAPLEFLDISLDNSITPDGPVSTSDYIDTTGLHQPDSPSIQYFNAAEQSDIISADSSES